MRDCAARSNGREMRIARTLAAACLALTLTAPTVSSAHAETLESFADTKAADDAKQDVDVGRFYIQRRDYLAAINRFKIVLLHHRNGPNAEEALAHLAESYLAIGVPEEAQTAAAIL